MQDGGIAWFYESEYEIEELHSVLRVDRRYRNCICVLQERIGEIEELHSFFKR